MARKSGWQEFADNFNSTYGTFKKIGMDYETAELMDDEKFKTGLGKGLKGTELDRARYKALGDIYTKYGDAKSGLAVRTQLAGLEKADRDNDLQRQTFDELVKQNGYLRSNQMMADTFRSSAQGKNAIASANSTTQLLPEKIKELAAQTRRLQLGNEYDAATQGARITATNAQNVRQADVDVAFVDFYTQVERGDFKNDQEKFEGLTKMMSTYDPQGAMDLKKNYNAQQVGDILQSSLEDAAQVNSIIAKAQSSGGSSQAVAELQVYLDSKNGDDGVEQIRQEDGSLALIHTGPDGEFRGIIAQGRSETDLLANMSSAVTPGNMAQFSKNLYDRAQGIANLDSTRAGTENKRRATEYQGILNDTARYAALVKNDNTQAQTELANAQAEKLKQEVNQEAGLTWNDKQAQKAFGSFLGGNTYATLALELQDEPGKLKLYENRVKFGLGLIKKPPASFTESEEVWLQMTDADRGLFR
jgi:hypothetical protein